MAAVSWRKLTWLCWSQVEGPMQLAWQGYWSVKVELLAKCFMLKDKFTFYNLIHVTPVSRVTDAAVPQYPL